jgi:DNA-binding transcriptional ArsR family regulator
VSRPASATPGTGPAEHGVGTPENPLKITDPRALRALAHPARIAILQHLALDGPATATECAEVAGLSPSACSYHLRALARFGFVEEEPASAADGRHRPWRARVIAFAIGDETSRDASGRAAGLLLRESLQARIDELRAEYFDREPEYPREWREAAGAVQDVLHVSAEELTAVRKQVQDLLARYRRLDPGERPPDAERVHATFELIPWFTPGSKG